MLWLPLRAYTFLIRLGFSPSDSSSPLADSALLLLLVLINHTPQQNPAQLSLLPPRIQNPYRAAIIGLQDSEDVGTDAESGRGQTASGISAVPFSQLYNALGVGIQQEPSVLLLYVLLHKCHRFQQYVLVRSDADTILLPLCHRYALLHYNAHLCTHPVVAARNHCYAHNLCSVHPTPLSLIVQPIDTCNTTQCTQHCLVKAATIQILNALRGETLLQQLHQSVCHQT